MKIGRVEFKNMANHVIKSDYEELVKVTTKLEKPKDYTEARLDVLMNHDFTIHTTGDLLRLEVHRGKQQFLQNFVRRNVDNRFHFNTTFDGKKLMIYIQKDSIVQDNFEELVELMYIHVLM